MLPLRHQQPSRIAPIIWQFRQLPQPSAVCKHALAVAETNQSYLNSNINQKLRLAHVEEVSYTESGVFGTDLTRLQNGADSFMDNVQTLRNTFAADTVSLITETGDACGLGYFMSTVSNSFESSAYSVVRRSCA